MSKVSSHFFRATLAFVAVCLAGVLTETFGASSAAAETWQAYTYNPAATMPANQGLARMFDRIKKESGGALTIELHLGGSLPIDPTSITSAVSSGVLAMADDGMATGNIPIAAIAKLPLLLLTPDDQAKVDRVLLPILTKAYADKGITLLGSYWVPFQVPFSRRKLTSLDDIKGQKIRVTSVEQGEFVRRFGGYPVSLGSPEVATALASGVIDGTITASLAGGRIWQDLLRYRYGMPVSYADSFIIVNTRLFQKLSPKLQAIVRSVVQDEDRAMTISMRQEDDDVTKKMATQGIIVTAASPQDIAKARARMSSYWGQWAHAHGPQAVAALAKIRAALGQ